MPVKRGHVEASQNEVTSDSNEKTLLKDNFNYLKLVKTATEKLEGYREIDKQAVFERLCDYSRKWEKEELSQYKYLEDAENDLLYALRERNSVYYEGMFRSPDPYFKTCFDEYQDDYYHNFDLKTIFEWEVSNDDNTWKDCKEQFTKQCKIWFTTFRTAQALSTIANRFSISEEEEQQLLKEGIYRSYSDISKCFYGNGLTSLLCNRITIIKEDSVYAYDFYCKEFTYEETAKLYFLMKVVLEKYWSVSWINTKINVLESGWGQKQLYKDYFYMNDDRSFNYEGDSYTICEVTNEGIQPKIFYQYRVNETEISIDYFLKEVDYSKVNVRSIKDFSTALQAIQEIATKFLRYPEGYYKIMNQYYLKEFEYYKDKAIKQEKAVTWDGLEDSDELWVNSKIKEVGNPDYLNTRIDDDFCIWHSEGDILTGWSVDFYWSKNAHRHCPCIDFGHLGAENSASKRITLKSYPDLVVGDITSGIYDYIDYNTVEEALKNSCALLIRHGYYILRIPLVSIFKEECSKKPNPVDKSLEEGSYNELSFTFSEFLKSEDKQEKIDKVLSSFENSFIFIHKNKLCVSKGNSEE